MGRAPCRLQALQDVHWAFSEPLHAFHPRAYNLSRADDFTAFDIDFKGTAAAAVLRVLLRDGGFHVARVPGEEEAELALRVCEARLGHLRCGTHLPPGFGCRATLLGVPSDLLQPVQAIRAARA
jgi:hypothetical protein